MNRRRSFRFLWITDPWESLDHAGDTTLRLAQEALLRGCECSWADVRSIRLEAGFPVFDARRILSMSPDRKASGVNLGTPVTCRPGDFDSIHNRTDPPVDLSYLHPLQILALAPRKDLRKFTNPLEVLLGSNEKLEAAKIEGLMPPTLASADRQSLMAFGRTQCRAVLKPLHEAQSHGIELLDWSTPDKERSALTTLERASSDFTRPVLLQKYLEGIRQGELRLWFLDGRLLACIRKLPLAGDFRVDMDRGSRLAKVIPSSAERKTAGRIGSHLRRRKIRLAAVDLIDGFVTDFNFTSPGLIVQMEATLRTSLAGKIIQALGHPGIRNPRY